MLFDILIALVLIAVLVLSFMPRRKHPPTHCRCGKVADVYDPDKPSRAYCAKHAIERRAHRRRR